MKKLQLLFAAMLIGLTSATASEVVSETKTVSLDKTGEDFTITKRYRYTQPILFVERGVEFLIFPDGSFDFNTQIGRSFYNDYQRGDRSRRGSINRSYNAPGTRVQYTSSRNRGVRVIHDRWGNVRRVGNVFINYDWNGRVKRVGTVHIRYQRNRLVQVGGLRLLYKKGRLYRTQGRVNQFNRGFRHDQNFDNGWFDDDFYDDDDFYYYKKDGKQKKFKKNKKFKKDKKFKNRRYDD